MLSRCLGIRDGSILVFLKVVLGLYFFIVYFVFYSVINLV